jgi:hypothetical protein
MTKEEIVEINNKCPYNQGIFFQPSMIPVHIKEHVIYSRYETGRYSGGNCWDDSNPRYYETDIPEFIKLYEMSVKQYSSNINNYYEYIE